jgi:hypothetical protein
VQPAHPVHPLCQPHPHHGHVEHLGVAAGVGLRAQREHPVDGQRRVAGRPAEVLLDQGAGEPVDAGRHRGVRGEHRARPAHLDRLVEAQPRLRVLADPLQAEEAGVALVGVEDLRLRMAGQRAERPHRPHSPHSQQQLLPEPVLAPATVEPVGDLPQGGLVLLHVGVEQQQRHPAHLGQPDLRGQHPALGQRDGDPDRRPAVLPQQRQRQPVRVGPRVMLLLPAFRGQRLAEVAVPVQQPHPDQRHAQVARGLEMVTGQNAEPAGVLGEGAGDAVLRREVGDRRRGAGELLRAALVPARPGQVPLQLAGCLTEPREVARVGGELGQVLGRHLAEQGGRVPARLGPAGRIDRGEQLAGGGVPGPAEVQHQPAQRGERLRQRGPDNEVADGSHAP